jgi:hypothetical protein
MDVRNIMENLKNDITKGNKRLEQLLEIYAKWSAVDAQHGYYSSYTHSNYFKFFGIARLLNVKHIYDIGCGTRGLTHAFLMHHFPSSDNPDNNVSYHGIDCQGCESLDFDFFNKVFADGWNYNITFEQNEYPCRIVNRHNNIALKIGSGNGGRKAMTKMAEAYSNDFERVIIEVVGDEADIFSDEMNGFERLDFGDPYGRKYVFFTKYRKDINFLSSIKYDWMNDLFSIESVFMPQYDGMYETFR